MFNFVFYSSPEQMAGRNLRLGAAWVGLGQQWGGDGVQGVPEQAQGALQPPVEVCVLLPQPLLSLELHKMHSAHALHLWGTLHTHATANIEESIRRKKREEEKYRARQQNRCYNVFKDVFIEDGLHMNKKGYDLWEEVMSKHLIQWTMKHISDIFWVLVT